MFHTTQNVMAAGGVLAAAFRAGDFHSAETVDAAAEIVGGVNAYRANRPFGEADAADVDGKSDEELLGIVEGHAPQAVGSSDDGEGAAEVEAIPPFVLAALVQLAVRALLKRFGR